MSQREYFGVKSDGGIRRDGSVVDWDARTHLMDDCRAAAAHKDFAAYKRAAKAAGRLFP